MASDREKWIAYGTQHGDAHIIVAFDGDVKFPIFVEDSQSLPAALDVWRHKAELVEVIDLAPKPTLH